MIQWIEYDDVWLSVKGSARTTINKDVAVYIHRIDGKNRFCLLNIVQFEK